MNIFTLRLVGVVTVSFWMKGGDTIRLVRQYDNEDWGTTWEDITCYEAVREWGRLKMEGYVRVEK